MMKMYNTYEAAKLIGIKVRTIRQWIRDGKIKAIRYTTGSNRWYIPSEEIERITGTRG